ncbi:MAG: hypothetical protein NTZ20_05045 [Candidatus Levybacteria bacterium]|nr:hypothetical protein [Candidatus Levybacteria bacterium]
MSRKIGIIQVRGIGDAIIALPIAEYYSKMPDTEVFFALDDRFVESFQYAAPYCTFVPVPFSTFIPENGINNEYWYEIPKALLQNLGCSEIISFPYHESHLLSSVPEKDRVGPEYDQLINRLNGQFEARITNLGLYNHLKFDEYKYATAQVPFENKWNLNIRRNSQREGEFYHSIIKQLGKKNVVCHLEGSDMRLNASSFNAHFNSSEFNIIDVTAEKTNNIFDWLRVFENADIIITLDSVFANLVEQLQFSNNKFFIKRSSIFMTPVLKTKWNYVEVRN